MLFEELSEKEAFEFQDTVLRIMESPDRQEINVTVPCEIYGERVVSTETSSIEVGFRHIRKLTWEKAYNESGIFGGYNLTAIQEELLPIGG